MKDISIKAEVIEKVFTDNMAEILKDIMTGYRSPIKTLFEEEEFKKELQDMARVVFSNIIKSPEFQEQLKEKLLTSAVENMLKR